MKKVSIIIPYVRSDKVSECILAIRENAGVPDDRYEIIAEHDEKGVGCPQMVADLTAKATHPYVLFLGDDTVPEPDFLKHALDATDTFDDEIGVVGLNTQDMNREEGNQVAHWLAHKGMLSVIPGGQFFSTDYRHCFCDDELRDIAVDLNRWIFAEKSRIKHNHPINRSAPYDEMYARAYGGDSWSHDQKTYLIRKRARMKEWYGTRLAIALPLTDTYVFSQFFFSFVAVLSEHMKLLASRGNPISIDVLMPNFPGQIDAVRNDLVRQALFLGCTHILMMDTDQIYASHDMIERMLKHDVPVIGARVHRRYPPFDPLLLRGTVGSLESVHDDEIVDGAGRFNDFVKVDYTGAGCVLYDTTIFIETFPDKWFEFKTTELGQPVGEDIAFCEKLNARGVDIHVDASIDIKHLTLHAVDWKTYKLFKKLEEVSARQRIKKEVQDVV